MKGWHIIAIMILAILLPIAGVASWFYRHPCIRSHAGWVYEPQHIQLLPCGKVLIPIVTPARTYWGTICDERK